MNEIFPTIAEAVAPLKAEAVRDARKNMTARIERMREQLAKHEWNIEALAPYPNGRMGRMEYRTAQRLRSLYEGMTDSDREKNKPYGYSQRGEPYYVTFNTEKAERIIVQAEEAAASSFELFVGKLNMKVQNHKPEKVQTAQLYVLGDTWEYSEVTICRKGGATETWRTRRILNFSVHGLAFHQWPTRIVK